MSRSALRRQKPRPRLASTLLTVSVAMAAAANCPGGSPDDAVLAAMKLGEQPNYSWKSTVTDDACTYEIEGKTNRRGWTWLRLPIVDAIAQRLGRDADTQIEAVFKSSEACVIRTINGWKTLRELPKRHRDWRADDRRLVSYPHRVGWGLPGPAGVIDREDPFNFNDPFDIESCPTIFLPAPPPAEPRRYSNAQFGLTRPHDELAVIVSSFTDVKVDRNVVTGTLSDLGAQLLLVRDGQEQIQPLAAAGIFKLLIQDGLVTKYLLRLEGILMVGRQRVAVRQVSSTVIKNIRATAFDIPPEALRKLEG